MWDTARIEFNIDPASLSAFADKTEQDFWAVKSDAQLAMGVAFRDIVQDNFGPIGADRPSFWQALKPKYAKRVGRTFATLYVSGKLHNAVKLDNTKDEGCEVSVSNSTVPYALVHQFGGGNNIPARPYFPVTPDGEVTPLTKAIVVQAAKDAVAQSIYRRSR